MTISALTLLALKPGEAIGKCFSINYKAEWGKLKKLFHWVKSTKTLCTWNKISACQ